MALKDIDFGSQDWLELQVLCKYEPDYNKRDDKTWQRLSEQWLSAKETLKMAEQIEEEARQALVAESQSMNSKGCGVRVQKITRLGSVKYSEIAELQGINLESYRKPQTESWRITNE